MYTTTIKYTTAEGYTETLIDDQLDVEPTFERTEQGMLYHSESSDIFIPWGRLVLFRSEYVIDDE